MEITDIISSGLLELYVLGLASEEENVQVENWIVLYPEVKTEIDNIQSAMEEYAFSHAVEPLPEVKSKILSQLNLNIAPSENAFIQNQDNLNGGRKGTANVVYISSYYKWAVAASVILLLGSLLFSYTLYNKYISAKSDLLATQQQLNQQLQTSDIAIKKLQESNNNIESVNQQLQKDQQTAGLTEEQLNHQKELAEAAKNELNHQKEITAAMNRDLDVVSDKYSLPVVLNGTAHAPDALAKIFWIKNTGDVYVDPTYLPEAPSGKQYQLWAIVDGKPESGGMISSKKGIYHIQKMRSFGKAQAFAITLEKAGGSPAPTMDEMYVMAKI